MASEFTHHLDSKLLLAPVQAACFETSSRWWLFLISFFLFGQLFAFPRSRSITVASIISLRMINSDADDGEFVSTSPSKPNVHIRVSSGSGTWEDGGGQGPPVNNCSGTVLGLWSR